MSIKNKVLAAAATMTMVGGASAVGLLPAQAATPSCGTTCVEGYGAEYNPSFVWDVLRQGEKAGQPIILFRVSNSDPAEDFTVTSGLVSTFGALSALDAEYPTYTAYEWQYSPYGVDSGLCIGVGSTAGTGTPVALEPCGESSKTLWIADGVTTTTTVPAVPPATTPTTTTTTTNLATSGAPLPLINGSETNFDHPYVLHYTGSAYPTDMPRSQLNTYELQEYAGTTPTVYNNELWETGTGIGFF